MQIYRSSRTFMVVLATGGVMLGMAIGIFLHRLIVPPLQQVCTALTRLADKDLRVQLQPLGKDEIGKLVIDLNHCADAMRDVMKSISTGTETLSSAALELSTRAEQAGGNAQSQSHKTQQIAAASQEMTATIGEIGHNLTNASNSSRESASNATDGGTVMQEIAATMARLSASTDQTVVKMRALTQRSEEIGAVVTTIQEISEQTNLLALNATIEAARAGNRGADLLLWQAKYDAWPNAPNPQPRRSAAPSGAFSRKRTRHPG